MTPHRRYQHGATAGAIILAAAATGAVIHRLYPHAALFGLGVLVLADAALRERRQHRRTESERAWARQKHSPYCTDPGPLTPCCLLHKHSRGQVHDARCTRPGQPGPPADEAFMAAQREHLEDLVAQAPVPEPEGEDSPFGRRNGSRA